MDRSLSWTSLALTLALLTPALTAQTPSTDALERAALPAAPEAQPKALDWPDAEQQYRVYEVGDITNSQPEFPFSPDEIVTDDPALASPSTRAPAPPAAPEHNLQLTETPSLARPTRSAEHKPVRRPAAWGRFAAAALVLCAIGAFAWWLLPPRATLPRDTQTQVGRNASAEDQRASEQPEPKLVVHDTPPPSRVAPPAPRARIVEFYSSVRHTRQDSPRHIAHSLSAQQLLSAGTPNTTSRPTDVTWRQTWTAP